MAKKVQDEAVVEVETTEAEAEEVIDLTEFEAAVAEALESADEATGTVPEANVAKVREAYQALPGIKPKNAAKLALSDGMKAALNEGQIAPARAYMALTEEAAVAGKSTAPAKQVDPAEAFRARVAAITLAGFLVSQDVPEGVSEDVVAEGQTLASELFAEAVAVFKGEEGAETESAIVRSAVKAAASKVRKGTGRVARSGERRDLGAHITEAFAAVEPGTFLSVADIRRHESSVYGDDRPSAGAISNRLRPKSGAATTIEGIEVEERDGKLGAVKA